MADDLADEVVPVRKPFPKTQQDLVTDERCAWSTESKSWILEDHITGSEWEWQPTPMRWTRLVSDEDMAKYMSAYKMPGVDENEPVKISKKRKTDAEDDKDGKKLKEAPKEQVNRAIYISNLPLEATEFDLAERFKKYGVLAIEPAPDGGERARITMYRDDKGNFKGDALLVYHDPHSIRNAIMMSDETDLYDPLKDGPMRVEVADMSYKKEQTATSGQPTKKPQRSKQDVERYKEIARKQNARLAEWDDDDPQTAPVQPAKPRVSEWVVCEHFFTLEALENDKELLGDIESMIRDEAKENDWGQIVRLVIYDLEPTGIVMLKFENSDLAQRAAAHLSQWRFDGRQLNAYVSSKKEHFRKTWKPRADNDDDEAARLEAFGRELEADGADGADDEE